MEGNPVVNMKTYIEDTFKPTEIFHNGNAWSFDYKEVQVDFITCSAEDYDSNYHYLAFNDLGNFIGAMFHQFKFTFEPIEGEEVKCILKYGQEGFFIKTYYESTSLGKFIISKDYPRIFKFIDLDYDQWLSGFNSLEDIFEYVSDSIYSSYELYQLRSLNKINRERNIKRKSYMSFLEWISKYEGTSKEAKYVYDNESIINKVMNEFPEFNNFTKDLISKIESIKTKKLINEKFNGNILIEKFGLSGKELGLSIKKFKTVLGEDFDGYILEHELDEILDKFKEIL